MYLVYLASVTLMASSLDVTSQLDVAINEKLTWGIARDILMNPLTWLPGLAYLSRSFLSFLN